jgi:hypothetical protein
VAWRNIPEEARAKGPMAAVEAQRKQVGESGGSELMYDVGTSIAYDPLFYASLAAAALPGVAKAAAPVAERAGISAMQGASKGNFLAETMPDLAERLGIKSATEVKKVLADLAEAGIDPSNWQRLRGVAKVGEFATGPISQTVGELLPIAARPVLRGVERVGSPIVRRAASYIPAEMQERIKSVPEAAIKKVSWLGQQSARGRAETQTAARLILTLSLSRSVCLSYSDVR